MLGTQLLKPVVINGVDKVVVVDGSKAIDKLHPVALIVPGEFILNAAAVISPAIIPIAFNSAAVNKYWAQDWKEAVATGLNPTDVVLNAKVPIATVFGVFNCANKLSPEPLQIELNAALATAVIPVKGASA